MAANRRRTDMKPLPLLATALALACAACAACAPTPPRAQEAISSWKSGAPDTECEIAGEAISWQADYCLLASGTDDLAAAGPCMHQESATRHGEECARRRYFKGAWCRRATTGGAAPMTLAQCIADPEQAGPVVKGGGLQ
jgi:hypothetical protein